MGTGTFKLLMMFDELINKAFMREFQNKSVIFLLFYGDLRKDKGIEE